MGKSKVAIICTLLLSTVDVSFVRYFRTPDSIRSNNNLSGFKLHLLRYHYPEILVTAIASRSASITLVRRFDRL